MSDEKQELEVQVPKPPKMLETASTSPALQMLYALRDMANTGKIDPISTLSYIMLIREMRRMEREDTQPQQQSSQIDIEKLIEKMNESWEKRFMEYQHRVETLLLGKRAEEAEKKAEELEKKIKEMEERERQEELVQKQIESAMAPLQERIRELQAIIQSKALTMTENERKSFFQTIGEEIEKALSSEVGSTITQTIKEALIKAFTKEEAPVTKEGKVDWIKMIDKWMGRIADTVKAVAEKMPARPPMMKPIQQIPIQLPQIEPTAPTTPTIPTPPISQPPPVTAATPAPAATTAEETTQPPTPTTELEKLSNVSRETFHEETVKSMETQTITEETKIEETEAGGSAEAAGEGAESKGSPQDS